MTRLGAPFKIYQPDVSPFRVEVARRIAAFNQAAGLPGDWAVPAAARARIRTEVAREFFVAEHGRQPEDARELAATIAKHSRPRTQAVAGCSTMGSSSPTPPSRASRRLAPSTSSG